MSGDIFTPEELAELAAFDAEIEAEPLTMEEIRQSRERDRAAVLEGMDARTARIAAYQAEYYAANRERIKARKAEYYAANRERVKAYQAANRERIKARKAEYYAANRERIAAQQAEYRAANRERIAAQKAEYYAANRERIAAQKAEYRKRKRAEKNESNTRPARPWLRCKGGEPPLRNPRGGEPAQAEV